MGGSSNKGLLRLIPPVDELLADPAVTALRGAHPNFPWTALIREVVLTYREAGVDKEDRDSVKAELMVAVVRRFKSLRDEGMRPVINGTGVILHTNLGRAIAGDDVVSAVESALRHYENLEVNLATGRRSGRGETLIDLIRFATGAEAAMVVNNNAAAVYLAVNSLSPPGRVLISRSELVEIGGSFRLPDILESAAAEVIEIGTTNRTYADDYAKIAREGDVFLRAHRSNYEIHGFTHEAGLSELVDLAREKKCHVVYDLGSGSFFDFDAAGFPGEERVADVVARGVDGVTMSGDKLLGGVQAGIVVGNRRFIDRLQENPLRRAFRIDKLTTAALQALFRTYLFEREPVKHVPVLSQTMEPLETLRKRADRIAKRIPDTSRFTVVVEDDLAAIGGGSFATREVESCAIVIRCGTDEKAEALSARMRNRLVPVLARIKGSEVRVNLRAVMAYEDPTLGEALCDALAEEAGES